MSRPKSVLLRDIAHARSGDKGCRATLSVIVYRLKDFALIEQALTAPRVRLHLSAIVRGAVERYELAHLGALHFVLHDALGGGVTRSLALDAHGKCLSAMLLSIRIEPTGADIFYNSMETP